MQHAVFRKILAVLFGLVLAATGLWASPAGEEEPAAAMEKEMVMDPATGKMVTAPEYGGTLTYAWGGRVSDNVDPFAVGFEAGWLIDGVNEKLAIGDWALDREVFDWTDNFVPTHVPDRESGGKLGNARPGDLRFFTSVRAFTTLLIRTVRPVAW